MPTWITRAVRFWSACARARARVCALGAHQSHTRAAAFPGLTGNPKYVAATFEKVLGFLFSKTCHLISNIDIEFTGKDTATVRAMVFNPMVFNYLPIVPSFHVIAYYQHSMVRVDGAWKSRELVETQLCAFVLSLFFFAKRTAPSTRQRGTEALTRNTDNSVNNVFMYCVAAGGTYAFYTSRVKAKRASHKSKDS